jgi:putative transposase
MKNAPSLRLSQTALLRLAAQLNLTTAALQLVNRILTSPHGRRTKGHRSVRGAYPSTKMGVTIQFERYHCKLPAIVNVDRGCEVLEFCDERSPRSANSQPGTL